MDSTCGPAPTVRMCEPSATRRACQNPRWVQVSTNTSLCTCSDVSAPPRRRPCSIGSSAIFLAGSTTLLARADISFCSSNTVIS